MPERLLTENPIFFYEHYFNLLYILQSERTDVAM